MTATRFDFRTYVFGNTGVVVMLIAVYVSVLCAGMFCASEIGYDKIEQLMLFYESTTDAVSGTNVDFEGFFKTALCVNIKYLFLIFVSEFLITGMIFVVCVIAVKAFYLGITLGCIYTVCGGDGFIFSVRTVFFQNLLSMPLMIIYAVVCISFACGFFKAGFESCGFA